MSRLRRFGSCKLRFEIGKIKGFAKKDWNAFAAARDHALAEMPAFKASTAVAQNGARPAGNAGGN
ncbi:MAG TPA: hypothetical protein VHX36_10890 [Candidatus Acidoferrales bacterium]|nr:hypothetical protein [Candidatus Acidoferrales bacterium]